VKVAFALAIQILLAQVSVPALKHEREKTQLIFFIQFRHTTSI
jgi:hypothetical protein